VSDDNIIKVTTKHTPIMIPWTQNPKPKCYILFYSKLQDVASL